MFVKLISLTPKAEELIAYCARVSSPNQDNPNYVGLLKYCIKNAHWSVFEQAYMTVEIGTSRAISAQILRHKSFNFQEFSQRYACLSDDGLEIYVARRQDDKNRQNSINDLPEEIQKEWEQRQLQNWRNSFEHYTWAINNKIAKECARFVLPLQSKTRIYFSGNIRSFIHYLNVRTGNGTQKEHMDIANSIKSIFVENLPIIAEACGWIKEKVE